MKNPSAYRELNLVLFGNMITYGNTLMFLTQLMMAGILIDSLLVTSQQLERILSWNILFPDLNRPINIDLARMKVRVFNS